jgi:hypothetical protein|mmetsp:Transcript_108983/g.184840  ORF Transcript_108983/g.184840 Transcript_108983/m.184840 type:complete len:236 (+) Transcript_108983:1207-1914(+)
MTRRRSQWTLTLRQLAQHYRRGEGLDQCRRLCKIPLEVRRTGSGPQGQREQNRTKPLQKRAMVDSPKGPYGKMRQMLSESAFQAAVTVPVIGKKRSTAPLEAGVRTICQTPHQDHMPNTTSLRCLLKSFIWKLHPACGHRRGAILCTSSTLAQPTLPRSRFFSRPGELVLEPSDSNSLLATMVSRRRGNRNSYTGKRSTSQRVGEPDRSMDLECISSFVRKDLTGEDYAYPACNI